MRKQMVFILSCLLCVAVAATDGKDKPDVFLNVELLQNNPGAFYTHERMVKFADLVDAHRKGLLVSAWLVQDRACYDRMTALGVDSVISGYPTLLMKVCK